jgi:hypothetical protein
MQWNPSRGPIKPPNVVSISYGQDEWSVTVKYAARQCSEYGKLGLMGSTILYATSDSAVAGDLGVRLGANRKLCHRCAHEKRHIKIIPYRTTHPAGRYEIQP